MCRNLWRGNLKSNGFAQSHAGASLPVLLNKLDARCFQCALNAPHRLDGPRKFFSRRFNAFDCPKTDRRRRCELLLTHPKEHAGSADLHGEEGGTGVACFFMPILA